MTRQLARGCRGQMVLVGTVSRLHAADVCVQIAQASCSPFCSQLQDGETNTSAAHTYLASRATHTAVTPGNGFIITAEQESGKEARIRPLAENGLPSDWLDSAPAARP